MRDTDIDADTIQAAANAVTEFVTVAFQPEFLRWEQEVNLAIAEMVWNFHSHSHGRQGARQPAARGGDRGDEPILRVAPHLKPLHDRLSEVRRARWPDADWMVLGLEARVDDGEIVFAFDLCWDDARFHQSCEMTWVQRVAGPVQTN